MSSKVEYVDLGLPSGILWSKCKFSIPYILKNGIVPNFENIQELRKYCRSGAFRSYSCINENYIDDDDSLFLHCIKFK